MDVVKVAYVDCLSVALPTEKDRLNYISDFYLLKILANRFCDANSLSMWCYDGNFTWSATKIGD